MSILTKKAEILKRLLNSIPWVACQIQKKTGSGRLLKQPGLKFSSLHISVIKCKFWSYDENMGPKLKKWSSLFWGCKKWGVVNGVHVRAELRGKLVR